MNFWVTPQTKADNPKVTDNSVICINYHFNTSKIPQVVQFSAVSILQSIHPPFVDSDQYKKAIHKVKEPKF